MLERKCPNKIRSSQKLHSSESKQKCWRENAVGSVLLELVRSGPRSQGHTWSKAGEVRPARVRAQRSKGQARGRRLCGWLSGQGARLGLCHSLPGPALVTAAGPRGIRGSQNLASTSRLEKQRTENWTIANQLKCKKKVSF